MKARENRTESERDSERDTGVLLHMAKKLYIRRFPQSEETKRRSAKASIGRTTTSEDRRPRSRD